MRVLVAGDRGYIAEMVRDAVPGSSVTFADGAGPTWGTTGLVDDLLRRVQTAQAG